MFLSLVLTSMLHLIFESTLPKRTPALLVFTSHFYLVMSSHLQVSLAKGILSRNMLEIVRTVTQLSVFTAGLMRAFSDW